MFGCPSELYLLKHFLPLYGCLHLCNSGRLSGYWINVSPTVCVSIPFCCMPSLVLLYGCNTSCFTAVSLTVVGLLICQQSCFLPLLCDCLSCYIIPLCFCLSYGGRGVSFTAMWLFVWKLYVSIPDCWMVVCLAAIWLLCWCLPCCYLTISLTAVGQSRWLLASCIPVCFVAVCLTTVRPCPSLRVVCLLVCFVSDKLTTVGLSVQLPLWRLCSWLSYSYVTVYLTTLRLHPMQSV